MIHIHSSPKEGGTNFDVQHPFSQMFNLRHVEIIYESNCFGIEYTLVRNLCHWHHTAGREYSGPSHLSVVQSVSLICIQVKLLVEHLNSPL